MRATGLLVVVFALACSEMATSPQELSFSLGQTRSVGGGAAEVLFAGMDIGAVYEVTCSGESERRILELVPGGEYEAAHVCGLTITALGIGEATGRIRVEW